jgi:hypothetical protein
MGIGPLDWLLPRSKRPRFVRFDVRGRVSLKLLMGRRVVGRYDYRRKAWQIRWPLRLFVDRKCLGRVPAATFHGEAAR